MHSSSRSMTDENGLPALLYMLAVCSIKAAADVSIIELRGHANTSRVILNRKAASETAGKPCLDFTMVTHAAVYVYVQTGELLSIRNAKYSNYRIQATALIHQSYNGSYVFFFYFMGA